MVGGAFDLHLLDLLPVPNGGDAETQHAATRSLAAFRVLEQNWKKEVVLAYVRITNHKLKNNA